MIRFLKHYLRLFTLIILIIPLKVYSSDTTLTQVKLQLKWKHQFQFAGYYAAIEKGYYKNVGLEVELIEAKLSELPGDAVINGKANFAISTSDVILMRADGKPVVVLATIFQHSAQILLATESSGIEYVHNLAGKRLIIEPHAADIIAYMNDEDISLNDIEVLPYTFDVNMLIENKVDAMTAYSTDEPFVLAEKGVHYHVLSPISGNIDFYGDVLITSEQFLLKNPKLAEDFRNASIKGWKYAMENPDELINIIYNKYSKRHSKEHLAFEAKKMKKLIIPEIIEIGYSNPHRWRKIIEVYKQVGMIPNDMIISKISHTDYLKKKIDIPWEIIIIFTLLLLFFGSIALFFYSMSKKLKTEISQRKQMHQTLIKNERKLQELNETKDKFFSIIAHDLKNPFNSMLFFSKLLTEDFEQYNCKKQKNFIAIIHKGIKNTYKLLENLLLWSQTQKGIIDFKPQNENLYLLLEETLSLLRQLAEDKGIILKNFISEDMKVWTDKNMLLTILRNLISNAIKFTPKGGEITVSTQLITDKNQQEYTQISVKDTGMGISKEKIIQLFKISENVSTKGTEGETGTGLGLILCKEFVEKHGGKIWVESGVGQGSEFIFTLPKL